MEQFERTRELSIKANDRDQESGAMLNMANLLSDMGNKKEAELLYLKTIKIRKELNDERGLLYPYANLGGMYKDQGRYSAAMMMLTKTKALAIKHKMEYSIASTSNSLGGVYKELGKIDSAFAMYQYTIDVCRKTGDKLFKATAYWNTSTLYREIEQFDSALIYLDLAKTLVEEIKHVKLLKSVYRSGYLTNRAVGNMDKAEKYMSNLMEFIDFELDHNFGFLTEKDKELYYTTMKYDFNIFSGFCLDYNSEIPELNSQAYNYALRTKGMLLKSSTAMRNAILSSQNEKLLNDYNAWIDLQKKIADNYANGEETDSLKKEAKKIESLLVKNSKEFFQYDQSQNLRWEDVQSALGEKEASIEFIQFKHLTNFIKDSSKAKTTYAALVMLKDSEYPQLELFDEDELIQVLGAFPGNNLQYIEQVYGTSQKPNNQLYQLIWEPIESLVQGTQTIYLSPVGLLHKVSFSAIAPNTKSRLCDLYDMQVLTSTGKIVETRSFTFDKNSKVLMI